MAERVRAVDCPHLPGSAVCDSCQRQAAEREAAEDVRWYRTGQGARVDTAEVGRELKELLRDAAGRDGQKTNPAGLSGTGGVQDANTSRD